METISLLWWFEDLACDRSENSEHSRHILGVHGFNFLTVKDIDVNDKIFQLQSTESMITNSVHLPY